MNNVKMPRIPGTGNTNELRGLTQVCLLSSARVSEISLRNAKQYIADLRACRVRELEEKRINKEMAHIRQKFKGASDERLSVLSDGLLVMGTEGNLDGYSKRK